MIDYIIRTVANNLINKYWEVKIGLVNYTPHMYGASAKRACLVSLSPDPLTDAFVMKSMRTRRQRSDHGALAKPFQTHAACFAAVFPVINFSRQTQLPDINTAFIIIRRLKSQN
ncbi:unnamed protein product [Cuscuta epithymum]|uniref:Uncharacterized protein n=1 Tax=Cuscuta epithymum TaxID=186058 RepID=A0AAV0D0F8_9ASTE|nr:unnamed protein product [Cuscuta epithymum]